MALKKLGEDRLAGVLRFIDEQIEETTRVLGFLDKTSKDNKTIIGMFVGRVTTLEQVREVATVGYENYLTSIEED
jgi:hypothetical protein